MAHKKGLGSSRNGRDSNAKRLGVKVFAGQTVTGGEIIVRQRGTRFKPGNGVGIGKDDTIYARAAGTVEFREGRRGRVISVIAGRVAPSASRHLLRVLAEQAGHVRRLRVQDPRRRPGHADRRQRQPRVVEHRRRDARDAELVLLVVGAVAAPADPREVVLQRLERRQRARGGGGSGASPNSAATSAGSRHASSALPAPDVCAGIARPISVNSRTLRVPETLST